MTFMLLSYNVLQWIGIFPSQNESKWTSWALNVYRFLIFIIIGLVIILMSIQMVVSTDLSTITRTIDIWTMFVSGFYKWYYMTMYNVSFSKLRTMLVQIQSQGTMVYGKPANLFTANYLKYARKTTIWYLSSGVLAVFIYILHPLLAYLKR